jgi:phosphate starvation-inducible protein PhoH and related proteins
MDKKIRINQQEEIKTLFGPHDQHIKMIEDEFNVRITVHNESIKISGSSVNIKRASSLIEYLLQCLRTDTTSVCKEDMHYLMRQFKQESGSQADAKSTSITRHVSKTKNIGPRTKGQFDYVEGIKTNDIIFGIGPAGTGKTYLAVACAVEALNRQEVRRIILVRPAIEAGESLGFLPGDMLEKIAPYLRPLYDALYDMMEAERIEKYIESGIIEVAPLAYMRGRTLNDAFIILDEAQNCTVEQMKMFLTRLGFDSKAVITGDLTQSDLPSGKPSGLLQATTILNSIEGIRIIYLTGADVVRHALVQRIIEAYDKADPVS